VELPEAKDFLELLEAQRLTSRSQNSASALTFQLLSAFSANYQRFCATICAKMFVASWNRSASCSGR
jgi:hypothetical protein